MTKLMATLFALVAALALTLSPGLTSRSLAQDWSGWSEVPGGGFTSQSPTAIFFNDKIEAFVTNLDGRILGNTLSASGWSGWSEVPRWNGASASGPSVGVNCDYRLSLFVRGLDDSIFENVLRFPGGWTGWLEVPGGGLTPSEPSAAVCTGGVDLGEEFLFVRGEDNRIYYNERLCDFQSCSEYSTWSEVPGGGFTSSGPAATPWGDSVYLFVRGFYDNRIYQNIYSGFRWSGWSEVPGGGFTSSRPAVTAGCDGSLHLLVRGYYDDRIWQNTLGRDGWSGWSEVPGNGFTVSGPAVTTTFGGLGVFVTGGDNRIYTNSNGSCLF